MWHERFFLHTKSITKGKLGNFSMKEHLKNFGLLTGSTLIMAVGIYFFKFANNFTFGGITGFAVLVARFTPLSASDFSFIANMLLLIVGLFVLGKKFAAQTAYSSILLSVTLSGLERIYPMSHPLTTNRFWNWSLQLYFLLLDLQFFLTSEHPAEERMSLP